MQSKDIGGTVYPPGVTENNAPWNQPEPWLEEYCHTCKHQTFINQFIDRGIVSRSGFTVYVCTIDKDDLCLCDYDSEACESWEGWM